MSMPRGTIWEWQGHEYSFEAKAADWYWALGIIAVAIIIVAILFGNVILALVTAAGAGALALEASKPPREHYFAITDKGVIIDRNLYVYEDMLSFTVLEYADESLPPSLSIKTKHFLAPHLLIPIVGHDPVEIYDFFIGHIPEGKHEESVFDHLIGLLRL
jgi:hypothetical protein